MVCGRKAVYTATSNIPSTAGKIMMNVWPGIGVNDWLKPFDGKTPLTASYEWVTYQSTAKAQTKLASLFISISFTESAPVPRGFPNPQFRLL